MQGRCIAYTEAGAICGQPAVHVDAQRGGLVCERCHNEDLRRLALASGSRGLVLTWARAELDRQTLDVKSTGQGGDEELPF